MAGKGKNFGRHQKVLQRPSTPAAPPEPQITLQQIQSKRNIPKSQALVDLDHAEDIALKLLDVCASTTDQYAAMAEGNTGEGEGDGDEKNDGAISDGKSSSMSTSSSTSNDEQHRITKIQKNGIEFREKLKKIHDLLSPHAHLVVNYSNQHQQQEGGPNVNVEPSVNPTPAAPSTSSDANANDEDKNNEEENQGKRKNMYASRLEMRLAIERRNLLRDMLKLEKERRSQNAMVNPNEPMNESIENQKRKRED